MTEMSWLGLSFLLVFCTGVLVGLLWSCRTDGPAPEWKGKKR